MSKVFGLYETDEAIKSLQRFLNETLSLNLKADGNIGKITQEAISNYQKSIGIVETNNHGVCYGEQTQAACAKFIKDKYLTEEDYTDAAMMLGVDVASIKAFAKTESKEFGFLNNGQPVILFERHKFYKYVSQKDGRAIADKYSVNYPDICNAAPGGYLGGSAEIKRLEKACSLNNWAGLMSASYGLYQILGENYTMCNYSKVESFVTAMKESERKQLEAFVYFIKADKILYKALLDKNWEVVARRYNGPNYKINNYAVKLADNYKICKN